MSQEENVTANTISKPETSSSRKSNKQELELDELVGKMSIEGVPQVSQKLSKEEKHAYQLEADSRSIFVGNITLDVTPEQIEELFQDCGIIKRITLLYDRNTGAPKGYGYIEFESPAFREKALQLNGAELKGKKIAVSRKRTNIPGFNRNYNTQNQYFQQWQWNYPLMAYPNPDTFPYYPQYPQINLLIRILDITITVTIEAHIPIKTEIIKRKISMLQKIFLRVVGHLLKNPSSYQWILIKISPEMKSQNKHQIFHLYT